MIDKLLRFFGAGAFGGLMNSLEVWVFGVVGISALLGVGIAPALTPAWLYPRIVWGGLWGLLLFIPRGKRSFLLHSLLISLGPTSVQLFIVFPLKANQGMAGIGLGLLTPVLVVAFNWIWAMSALVITKK